jgi:hypothetical protein
MNKILLNNFPYPTQQIGAKKVGGAADPISFIHGFDTEPLSIAATNQKLATDILQAILIHDVISLELIDVYTPIFSWTTY